MSPVDGKAPRIALVTGAGSGLGRATAALLAAAGTAVACLDRDAAAAELTVEGIDASGGSAWPVACDVAKVDHVPRAVDEVVGRHGRLDVLVNAAGVALAGHSDRVPVPEWDRVLQVNLTGTFLVTRAALPALVAARGCVVNVASVAALRGWPYMAAYAASKGGVVALTRSLAVEFAARGVRVNCVCPGSIDTPLVAGLDRPADADPALLSRSSALVDPPRAQPDEVAHTVVHLCSSEARFTTGAVYVVDGGVLA